MAPSSSNQESRGANETKWDDLAILALLSERRLWTNAKRYAWPLFFQLGSQKRTLWSCPDIWTNRVLDNFWEECIVAFPSFLVTAGNLRVVCRKEPCAHAGTTRHAALMAKRVTTARILDAATGSCPYDELGDCATFNHLLKERLTQRLQLLNL